MLLIRQEFFTGLKILLVQKCKLTLYFLHIIRIKGTGISGKLLHPGMGHTKSHQAVKAVFLGIFSLPGFQFQTQCLGINDIQLFFDFVTGILFVLLPKLDRMPIHIGTFSQITYFGIIKCLCFRKVIFNSPSESRGIAFCRLTIKVTSLNDLLICPRHVVICF